MNDIIIYDHQIIYGDVYRFTYSLKNNNIYNRNSSQNGITHLRRDLNFIKWYKTNKSRLIVCKQKILAVKN